MRVESPHHHMFFREREVVGEVFYHKKIFDFFSKRYEYIKDLNIYSIQSIKQYLYYIYVIEATLVSPRRHTYTNTVLC